MNPPVSDCLGSLRLLCLTFLLTIAQGSPAAPEKVLNLQFGSDVSTPRRGVAATGLGPNDFWNLYSRDLPGGGYKTSGEVADLKWSDESPSGAGMTIDNAPGAWPNGSSDAMLGIFLYPFDGGNITVALTNLPAGTYRVYAYGHGGPPAEQNTRFELLVDSLSYGTNRTSTTPDWNDGGWTEGSQYVAFRGVVIESGTVLKIISMPDSIPQAVINGLQLVKESEGALPDTLINVNFGRDATAEKRGPAATGQTTNDGWNLYSRDDGHGGYRSVGVLTNLLFASGTASGASLQIENAPGGWGNGHPDAMFGSFLYPLGGGPEVTVTITHLVPGAYDVFCYGHGGPGDEQNTTFEVLAGHTSYGNQSTTATSRWRDLEWSKGDQYVLFHRVLVPAGAPLVIEAKPAGINVGLINGVQILRTGDLPLEQLLAMTPSGGLFTNTLEVTISSRTEGEIRYTVDGSSPLMSSPLYSEPIRLVAATTIKALLFNNGHPASQPAEATFARVYALDDGIRSDWRQKYFGDGFLTDPRVAADADPDLDGVSNLQEFGAGSDPTDPLSGFRTKIAAVPQVRWNSVPGQKYRILKKTSIPASAWIVLKEFTATEASTRFTDEDNVEGNSFYLIEPVR